MANPPRPDPDRFLLVRVRAQHGRTYWLIADGDVTRAFGPQIARDDVLARFQAERERRHVFVEVVSQHHSPSEARLRIARWRAQMIASDSNKHQAGRQ